MFNSKEKRIIAGQMTTRIAYAAITLAAWTVMYYGLGEWIGLFLATWTKNTDINGLKSILNFVTSCLVLRLAFISVLPSTTSERCLSGLKQYTNFYFLSQGIVHMAKLYNSSNTNVPQEMIIASAFIGVVFILKLLMRYINTYVTKRTAATFVGISSKSDDLSLGNLDKFITARDEKDIDDFLATINDSQDLITDNYKPYVDMLNLKLTKTRTLDGEVTGTISFLLGFKIFRNAKNKWLQAFHFPLTGIIDPVTFNASVYPKPLGKAVLVEHKDKD